MNKKVSIWFVLLLIWFFCLLIPLFGYVVLYTVQGGVRISKGGRNIILSIAKFPDDVARVVYEIFYPIPMILPDYHPRIDGFKPERKNYKDSSYLLISFYNVKMKQASVKLVRLYDGKIVHQWIPDINKIINLVDKKSKFWTSKTRFGAYFGHPLLGKNGELYFNCLGLLVKINRKSELVWTRYDNFNHSQEFDAEGNIWVPSFIENSNFLDNIVPDYAIDEAITQVSPNGKILYKKSICEILIENGYKGLLLGTGMLESSVVHLNEIQPALKSSKYWLKNDLLISLRNKSTVFLFRPSTNKIIWLKTGPWIDQHAPDFIDEERIGVYGNNVIRTDSKSDVLNGHNELYIFNFNTNSISIPYSKFFKLAKVKTISGGRWRILPQGDLFVEESDYGRLLRGNSKKIVWQFVERIDQKSISSLSWTRLFLPNELPQNLH